MIRMPRAVRCVILAALVVSALLLGAISIHAMSAGSPAMSGAAHVMGSMTTTSEAAPAHGHEHTGANAQHCDGACEASHALVGILCVVAGVALLLLVLLPRRVAASVILSSLIRRETLAVSTVLRPSAPSLTQLSISRT